MKSIITILTFISFFAFGKEYVYKLKCNANDGKKNFELRRINPLEPSAIYKFLFKYDEAILDIPEMTCKFPRNDKVFMCTGPAENEWIRSTIETSEFIWELDDGKISDEITKINKMIVTVNSPMLAKQLRININKLDESCKIILKNNRY